MRLDELDGIAVAGVVGFALWCALLAGIALSLDRWGGAAEPPAHLAAGWPLRAGLAP